MEGFMVMFMLMMVVVVLAVLIYNSKRISDVDRKATSAGDNGAAVRYDSALLASEANGQPVPKRYYFAKAKSWAFALEAGSNVQIITAAADAFTAAMPELDPATYGSPTYIYRPPDNVQYRVKSVVLDSVSSNVMISVYAASNATTGRLGVMGSLSAPAAGSNVAVTLVGLPARVAAVV
jgi:hypothetical protein